MGRSDKSWTAALTVLTVLAALIWPLSGDVLFGSSWGAPWLRAIVLAAGPTFTVVLGWKWFSSQRCHESAAERFLASLCRADLHELGNDEQGLVVPVPAAGPRWLPLLEQIHAGFREHGRKIQDLEQSRAALEIRCRRAIAQAELIKGILSGLPEPILAIDAFDDLALVNSSAAQLFEIGGGKGDSPHLPERPEGCCAQMGTVPFSAPRAAKSLLRCQKLVDLLLGTAHHKSTGPRTEEIEINDAAGQAGWYRATAARLDSEVDSSDEERSGGAVVVLRNIADQKALQKRNAEFVSSVSHEMKTPLAGIKAYVELLADGDAEDEATREEFLSVINGQADRLQRLVENLLNLARIEAGVVHVSKEPRSLNSILEEALNLVQPSAESKSIRLTNDLSPLYLPVLADRDMMLQAAINLLSNAIKYTPVGGRVTLRSRMEEGQVRFEVQDTGVGLSPDDCLRVFEKFYRVNKNKDMATGTGLGLPLAKHIVEDVHGGRLTVESKLGQGSTFSVTLRMKE